MNMYDAIKLRNRQKSAKKLTIRKWIERRPSPYNRGWVDIFAYNDEKGDWDLYKFHYPYSEALRHQRLDAQQQQPMNGRQQMTVKPTALHKSHQQQQQQQTKRVTFSDVVHFYRSEEGTVEGI
jgi:hypothetical protein